jgi:hypothetical protein
VRISRTLTEKNRDATVRAVAEAPLGAQVEIMLDPHTGAQRRMMWSLLTDIAEQVRHCGQRWDSESWKCAFLRMMGKKMEFMPALDGDGVVAIGYHSSRLSKAEMSEMIMRIQAYGDEHGVKFRGDEAA